MKVYLQRHCTPKPGERMNPDRPLTDAGKAEAADMADFLVRQIGRVDIVISSPFARAKETADIMAKALGSYVATTKELEPDAKPKDAWAEVKRLAQASEDVLVVSHHPLIGHMVDYLADNTGIGHEFQHGSIACVVPDPPAMRWLVDREIAHRQNQIDAAEAAFLADSLEMAAAGLELAEAVEHADKRDLKHDDHAKLIKPIVRKAKKLFGSYFSRQKDAVLADVKPWLKLHMKEAEVSQDDANTMAATIFPDTLQSFLLQVTTQEQSDYRGLIEDAVRKAAAQLDTELLSGATIPETAMGRYLEQNSLSKLTGELAETSKQRLRDAIADAVQKGGTADDIVEAIQDTFEDFSDVRSNMIAQTEVNDAYNFGRTQLATSAGLDEKAWITESGAPCVECLANEAEGWIDIDGVFLSGDEMPTAHPMCYCSLDFRKVS